MPVEVNSSYERLELTGAIGNTIEHKNNSSQQQTSHTVNGKRVSPRANQSLKCPDKHKTQNPFSQPYLNPYHDLEEHAVDEHKTQLESSENFQKQCVPSKASKDDELVRYMSTIPGYLQQMEKGKNVQEKALNFGVLDWGRLEKWKYNERIPVTRHRKASSNSLSMASRRPTLSSFSPQRKQPCLCRVHPNSSPAERLRTDVEQEKVIKVQDSQVAPSNKKDVDQKTLIGEDKSSDRSCPETNIHKGKCKESDEKTILEVNALSDGQDRLTSFDRASAQDGKSNARVKKEVNLSHHHCPAEPQSIVQLLPKYSAKQSCSESSQFTDSRLSCDKQSTEANGSRFSDYFSSQELHFGEFNSELPQSCPLPASDIKSLTDVCPAPFEDEIPISPSLSKFQHSEANDSYLESLVSVEPSNRMDLAEQPATRGTHPSHNRRFSFRFGRLSRSFSFKDSSAVQLSSSSYTAVKSGPVSSEAPAGTENCDRDKPSASGRGRSSPLRRLLDPLMKPKGTHSAKAVHPSNGNSDSVSLKPMDNNELLLDRKHEASTFRALLQPTVKNGLPFFKLVVENSSDILAAAVKNIPTLGKGNSSFIYALYSVHEIKKKGGGWMSQGSKSKSHGFGYNVVGQMKISNGCIPDSNAQGSVNLFAVTESVLYNVDRGQEPIKVSEFCTSREIAAIVVRNPVDKMNDRVKSDKGYQCKEGSLKKLCEPGCNHNSNSTIVILPAGIHGLPNQGAPSSLINRWRSGGICDCGGWDMGCTLRILGNQDISSNGLKPCMSSTASVWLDLFSQGRAHERKPIFSMAPFKDGIYSVEFDKSISLPAAFSICIAVITSSNFSENLEMCSLPKANCFSEALTRSDCMKAPTIDQGQIPARYITSPPASPVGRI